MYIIFFTLVTYFHFISLYRKNSLKHLRIHFEDFKLALINVLANNQNTDIMIHWDTEIPINQNTIKNKNSQSNVTIKFNRIERRMKKTK